MSKTHVERLISFKARVRSAVRDMVPIYEAAGLDSTELNSTVSRMDQHIDLLLDLWKEPRESTE